MILSLKCSLYDDIIFQAHQLPSSSEIIDSCLFLSLVRFFDFSSSSAKLVLISATRSSISFLSYKTPVWSFSCQATADVRSPVVPEWFDCTFSSLLLWSSITRISSSSFLILPSQVTFSRWIFWRASSSSSKCSSNSYMENSLALLFLSTPHHHI